MDETKPVFRDVWEVAHIKKSNDYSYQTTVVVGHENTKFRVSLDSEALYNYLLVDFETSSGEECDGELVYLVSESGKYNPKFDGTQTLIEASGPEDYGMVRSLLLGLEAWTREPTGHHAAHAGCVSNGDVGCLLVGVGGSGKSLYSLLLAFKHGYQVVNDDWIDLQLVDGNLLATPVDKRLRLERSLLDEVTDLAQVDVDHDGISYELTDEDRRPEGLFHPTELGIRTRDECRIEEVILLVESPAAPDETADERLATLALESNRHIPGGIVAGEIPQTQSVVHERNEARREFWVDAVTANCSFCSISTRNNTRKEVAAFIHSRLRN